MCIELKLRKRLVDVSICICIMLCVVQIMMSGVTRNVLFIMFSLSIQQVGAAQDQLR